MAKKNKKIYEQESNPLKVVLYIVAVLVLIGCIGYLIYSSRLSKKEYEELVKRAAAGETEFAIEEREAEMETEENISAKIRNENGTGTEAETDTEAVSAMTSLDGAEDSEEKEVGILVLNGTGKPGVAGYWKTQLENAGYTNVIPASYIGTVEEETVIYAAKYKTATPFKEYFSDATVKIGKVENGIEAADGITLPEESDVYIVIGSKDARSE